MIQRKKLLAGGFLLCVLAGLGWQFFGGSESSLTRKEADAFIGSLRTKVQALEVGSITQENGTTFLHNVQILIPAFPQEMPIEAEKVAFNPNGSITAQALKVHPPSLRGTTFALDRLTLSEQQRCANGQWCAAKLALHGVSIPPSTPQFQALMLPLQLMLLAQPKALQELPDKILKSIGDLDAGLEYAYNPQQQQLKLAKKVTLPGFLTISLFSTLDGITQTAFTACYDQTAQALASPTSAAPSRLMPACLAALGGGSPVLLDLAIQDTGAVQQAFTVYALLTRASEKAVRDDVIARLSTAPVPAPAGNVPYSDDVHVAEVLRRAALAVARGERSIIALRLTTQNDATLGQVLAAFGRRYGYGALVNIQDMSNMNKDVAP
jgi:hypothetical protein